MSKKLTSLNSGIVLTDKYTIFTPEIIRFLIKKAESPKNRESSTNGFERLSFIIEDLCSDYLKQRRS